MSYLIISWCFQPQKFFTCAFSAQFEEQRIHPYGQMDLGEVPFAMANFARRLGMVAQSYCRGRFGWFWSPVLNGTIGVTKAGDFKIYVEMR